MSELITTQEKDEESIEQLPAKWRCTIHRTTSYGKLVAMFEHETMSVRIRPWKTYEQPGVPNVHRVTFHDDEREVLAIEREGEEAERVALTAMEATQ